MRFTRDAHLSSGHSSESACEDPGYFFLEQNSTSDSSTAEIQQAIIRILPGIRAHVRRMLGDDSRLEDVVDRLYIRLRNSRNRDVLNEDAVWSRLISIVHEERRRDRKRFGSGAESRPLEEHADPDGLEFVTEVVRKDQLRAFRECLDPWTCRVFDVRFSSPVPLKSKELAARFGLKVNTFDQRWRRGIACGINEFRRRHTPGMQ
jgi:DNA-directed RNA polymerase specialized sigma24 family protein